MHVEGSDGDGDEQGKCRGEQQQLVQVERRGEGGHAA